MNLNDIKLVTIDHQECTLEKYLGNVLLIVNTASKCGFTPQYEQLEKMYKKYHDSGFEILGFPCNQFLEQEPADNSEIKTFCTLNYKVTFPMFAKIEVNGANAHELFKHLVSQKKFMGFDMSHPLGAKLDEILSKENPNYKDDSSIKWNFTKFLMDRKGTVVERFEPTHNLEDIERRIKDLL